MQNRHAIIHEKEFTRSLKNLTQAYEEIAVIKMQRVRSSVLKTRDFIDMLSEVFIDVKYTYKKQIERYLSTKQEKKASNLQKFGKKKKGVMVFVSVNGGLNGNIINEVLKLFLEDIKKYDFDIVIIGRHGRNLFDINVSDRKYEFFDLPEKEITIKDIASLVSLLSDYETVRMYAGKFSTMGNQIAQAVNISGDEQLKEREREGKKTSFLIEPTLEKVLEFFQTQVFSSLLAQTIHESELSRLASRITAMEDSIDRIGKIEQNLRAQELRAKKSFANKKQRELLSGISLWSK